MLALAFVVTLTLLKSQAKRQNIHSDIIVDLSFLVFISGIIGARLLYISENLDYYLKYPAEMIMLQHGGLSWFGAFILGAASGIIYLRKKNLHIYKILDLFIPFVALGQAIGRIGCLLNGCCFGQIFFIPIQIISASALIFIFLILRFWQERKHRVGQIFSAYLLLYAVKRFFLEFWRQDHGVIFMGLTLFQILSLALLFLSLLQFFLLQRAKE
jgi:phosphatidylglycerol:prolipoprotein diacylglycerol transferase